MAHALEQPALHCQDLLLGVEDQCFVFLEFRRDVTLGIDHCLFTDVVVRDFGGVRVRHFDVIAEDLVVADLQRRDTGALAFLRFKVGDPLACMLAGFDDLVEFVRVSGADDADIV